MTRSKYKSNKYEVGSFLGDFSLPNQRLWTVEFDSLEGAVKAATQQHAEMIYAHGPDVWTCITHDDGETVDWIVHKQTILDNPKDATALADKLAED